MKKIKPYHFVILISVLALGILLLFQIPYYRIMNNTPSVWYPTLRVFQTHSGYHVYLLDGKRIHGSICFSADGQLLDCWNVKPITEDNSATFLEKHINEIAAQYGAPHADVGSGFYIPAYISEDARLIILYTDESVVNKIVVKDLITDAVTTQEDAP